MYKVQRAKITKETKRKNNSQRKQGKRERSLIRSKKDKNKIVWYSKKKNENLKQLNKLIV
jgi:hypothetical protein